MPSTDGGKEEDTIFYRPLEKTDVWVEHTRGGDFNRAAENQVSQSEATR